MMIMWRARSSHMTTYHVRPHTRAPPHARARAPAARRRCPQLGGVCQSRRAPAGARGLVTVSNG